MNSEGLTIGAVGLDSLEQSTVELLAVDGAISQGWNRRPVHISAPEIASAIPKAADLLRIPLLRPPYVTMLVDGAPQPADRFCRQITVADSQAQEWVVDEQLVSERMTSGASVKFNRMELWCPEIAAMARGLKRACGREIRCWGFFSRQAQRMLPWHRDRAHVLAVQLEGTKCWQIGDPYPEGVPRGWQRIADPERIEKVSLREGEVFYLPQGFAHCAAAETEASFHISFGLESVTAGDLHSRLLAVLTKRLDQEDPGELRADNLVALARTAQETLLGVSSELEKLAATAPTELEGRLMDSLDLHLAPQL